MYARARASARCRFGVQIRSVARVLALAVLCAVVTIVSCRGRVFGVVWCSLSFGVVWCRLASFGVVRCRVVLFGVIWCRVVLCGGVVWCVLLVR